MLSTWEAAGEETKPINGSISFHPINPKRVIVPHHDALVLTICICSNLCPNLIISIPEKLLSFKRKTFILEGVQIPEGISPQKLFFERSRNCKLEQFPSYFSTSPLKPLSDKSNNSKLNRLLKIPGKLPIKLASDMRRVFNLFNAQNSFVMVEWNNLLLEDTPKYSRLDKFPIHPFKRQ